MTEKKDEFTFEFEDIPKEKYKQLEELLMQYVDVKISRETYLNKVEELLSEEKIE